MNGTLKKEILELTADLKRQGVSEVRTCNLLQLSSRRLRKWRTQGSFEDRKSGPKSALHKLLNEEKEAILLMACNEKYVDESHRVLAARGSDEGLFHVSASSVYRVMQKKGLTVARTDIQRNNGNSRKPDRPELTCANQRWCWDISYLSTFQKGAFLYLYMVLDEYSRKIVAWRIGLNLQSQQGMELIDNALENEGLDKSGMVLPDLYNDRGVQMKAKKFVTMLKDLGMGQVFSRPRTPNDNPFIESIFSTIKGNPNYPNQFEDLSEAMIYFVEYVNWYNKVRLHGKIGFVTPEQKHDGLDKNIIEKRKQKKKNAREERLRTNRESEVEINDKAVSETTVSVV